jgi:DNA polymerase-1
LVDPDLSSLEYRLIAHAAGEHKLISAFKRGNDIHAAMFYNIFKRDPKNEVERKAGGKTPNYCSIYGGGKKKFVSVVLKDMKGLTRKDVERIYYEKVKGAYLAVDDWKEKVIDELHERHKIKNLFGRVREFRKYITQDDEREAINWIIQSSGHDILEIYLMEVVDQLGGEENILLVNEIHDAFVLDCAKDQYKKAAEVVEKVGHNLNILIEERFGVRMRVPILAEAKILKEWK